MEDKILPIPAESRAQILTLQAYIRAQLETSWRCEPLLLWVDDKASLPDGLKLHGLFQQEIQRQLQVGQGLWSLDTEQTIAQELPSAAEHQQLRQAGQSAQAEPHPDRPIKIHPRSDQSHQPTIQVPQSWCGASMWIITAGPHDRRIERLAHTLRRLSSSWLAVGNDSASSSDRAQAATIGRVHAVVQSVLAQVEWIDLEVGADQRGQWRQQNLQDTQNWQRLEAALRTVNPAPIPQGQASPEEVSHHGQAPPIEAQKHQTAHEQTQQQTAAVPASVQNARPAPARTFSTAPASSAKHSPLQARDLPDQAHQADQTPLSQLRAYPKRRWRTRSTINSPRHPIDLQSGRAIAKPSLR